MRFLSNKEKKVVKEKLPKSYDFDKKDELKETNDFLYKNGEKFLIFQQSKYLPYIESISQKDYPILYVDDGAISFVTKGADLMKPGIEEMKEDFQKDEIVIIKNKNFPNKILALGISLFSKDEISKLEKGKVIKIYHYLGDTYFKQK